MKTKTSAMYAEAYKYVEVWGFSVIPCGKDKRPILKSWKEFQTRKPTIDELEKWFGNSEANIGIVTGEISGITVIDVDTHKGASPAPFPKTYTVRTGNGGLQLYYKYSPGLSVSANAYPQFPNVDIRSDGGFVIAPPSVIIPSTEVGRARGGKYEIEDPQDFQTFPAQLFTDIKKRRKLPSLIGINSGSRNDSMASVIGTLIHKMEEKDIVTDGWNAVVAINQTYKPPLEAQELETTFNSIVEKERQRRADIGKATPSPIQLSPTERMDILLRKSSNGVPYKDMANAIMVIDQHPLTKMKIRYNEFKQEIEINGKAFEDSDLHWLVHLMQRDAGLPNISKDAVLSAVQHYAYENKYDEAADWLKSLKWDGKGRLSEWLLLSTGVADDPDNYHRAVGVQWFCGMVRRLMNPGCIFDHVLVIVGDQGIGKTSLFRIIGGPWYKSFTGTVENKDFYLALRGAAVIDLDEGVALYKSESIKMKSIITQTTDEYRAPYDKMMKKYPRRFVFSMSTNDSEPFRDVTGNRRYWPIDVKQKIDFKWLEDNREQLFAEAYHIVKNNIVIPIVNAEAAHLRQEDHLPGDEWAEPILNYLRQSFLYCSGDAEFETTVGEVYDKVLEGDLDRLDKRQEIRIGTLLRKVGGLVRRQKRLDGQRVYRYVLTDEKMVELQKKNLKVNNPDKDMDDIAAGAVKNF